MLRNESIFDITGGYLDDFHSSQQLPWVICSKNGKVEESTGEDDVEIEGKQLALHQAKGVSTHTSEQNKPCSGARERGWSHSESRFQVKVWQRLAWRGAGNWKLGPPSDCVKL